MWKIKYHKSIPSDLRKLPKDVLKRFFSLMEILKSNPESVRLKPIKGFPGKYAIRIGSYRVIVEPNKQRKTFFIWMVAHRRAVYKRMKQRISG